MTAKEQQEQSKMEPYAEARRYMSNAEETLHKTRKEYNLYLDKKEELQGVVKMIDKHETEIINFFDRGHTNAKAERLNGKIQRFVTNNYGMKDKDFALYRIAGYFS
ncbi:hypothetical protein FACS1894195_3710 [Bacteroidia bacterium]|nr:hypothetical protein FACS1894195_3710 [Bacteroidia bacterium]